MTNVRTKKKKPKTYFSEFSALSFAFAMPFQLSIHIFLNYLSGLGIVPSHFILLIVSHLVTARDALDFNGTCVNLCACADREYIFSDDITVKAVGNSRTVVKATYAVSNIEFNMVKAPINPCAYGF